VWNYYLLNLLYVYLETFTIRLVKGWNEIVTFAETFFFYLILSVG